MHALQAGRVGECWARLGRDLPRPRAIVVASAHYLMRAPCIGGAEKPETLHDFGGFPDALYRLHYPAPGSAQLANAIARLYAQAGIEAHIEADRGFDHGVWTPLLYMYPEADIPVVSVSIQPRLGPEHQFKLGRALASLREQGVLLIGSGSITHNLHDWRTYQDGGEAPYVRPFTGWVEDKLHADDIAAMLDYRKQAPFAEHAHPTDEHLLPLFFAMGAAGGDALHAQRIDAGIDAGMMAMDVYRFGQ